MKNKKLITLFIILTIAVILVIFIVIKVNDKVNNKVDNELQNYIQSNDFVNKIKVSENKSINICKDDNCKINQKIIEYNVYSYDYDNKDFQNIVNLLNEDTNEKYNETINSVLTEDCGENYNLYKYRDVYSMNYMLRETEDFISIAKFTYKTDLCHNISFQIEPIIYIFDKKDKKVISNEAFMKKMNIRDVDLERAIEGSIIDHNNIDNTSYTYDDVIKDNNQKAYYTTQGDINLIFYDSANNKYQEVELLKLTADIRYNK